MPFDSTTFAPTLVQRLAHEEANPPNTFYEAIERLIPWLRAMPPKHDWDYSHFLTRYKASELEKAFTEPVCKTSGCACGLAELIWGKDNILGQDGGFPIEPQHLHGEERDIWTSIFLEAGASRELDCMSDITPEMVIEDIEFALAHRNT